ncbi:MAG: F0F1 ATP synthase subunit epsilon [Terriglobia bacterium]
METTLPQEIDLQLVTPERRVISATVSGVTLPGASGELGILPGHAPLVSELSPGVVTFEREGSAQVLATGSGFAEVLPGRVTVLVQTAETPDEIDLEQARRAMQQAESRLKKPVTSDADMREAQAAQDDLRLATARVAVSTRITPKRA